MADDRTFGELLYRAMKDGDDRAFDDLVGASPERLNESDDGCGATPLISAVFCERIDCLRALIEAGAQVDQRDTSVCGSSYRLRALEAAHWFDRDDMVQVLVDAGAAEDFGTRVFRGDVDAVRQDLDADPALLQGAYIHPHFTLLHVAAEVDSADLARLFVERGLEVDAEDGDGHTALRYAARNEPSLDLLDALVEAGANVDHTSRTGITALTAACRHAESLPTVRRLLELGADPNLVPKNRVSGLMKAAGNRVPEMVELLLAHGADPTYRGKAGESALDVARRRRSDAVVTLLEPITPSCSRSSSRPSAPCGAPGSSSSWSTSCRAPSGSS